MIPSTATTLGAAPAGSAAASALPSLGSTALSLVLVLALIFGLAALLKRLQGVRRGGTAGLRIQAGLQVGPKERVMIIEAGGQHLLIGVSASGVQTLHVFAEAPASFAEPASADVESKESVGAAVRTATSPNAMPPLATAFADALKRALGTPAKP